MILGKASISTGLGPDHQPPARFFPGQSQAASALPETSRSQRVDSATMVMLRLPQPTELEHSKEEDRHCHHRNEGIAHSGEQAGFDEQDAAEHPRGVEDSGRPGQATGAGQACGCEEQAKGIPYQANAQGHEQTSRGYAEEDAIQWLAREAQGTGPLSPR